MRQPIQERRPPRVMASREIAHDPCSCEPPHGPQFVVPFCELADAVMGPEVGYALRVVYGKRSALEPSSGQSG